jgi:hypothetical protein
MTGQAQATPALFLEPLQAALTALMGAVQPVRSTLLTPHPIAATGLALNT